MNRIAYSVLSVFLLLSYSNADFIDQQQLEYSSASDLSSYGDSGQTFIAGQNAYLVGISLFVEGARMSSSDPFGSDFTVSLRGIANGAPSNPVLTTGTLQKDGNIELDNLNWVNIYFDTPYLQTNGEHLAFTIDELSGGGVYGWNEYAMSSTNPYSGGQQFYSYTEGQPLSATDRDMAFKTIVTVPEPMSAFMLIIGSIILLYLRKKK